MADYGLNDLLAEFRTAQTPVASTVPEPHGKPGGGLWGHPGLMAPPYIEHVAGELMKQGHSESDAYHMAVGIVQNWAAGHDGKGHGVHADVQAAAAKNVAQWEALKARYGGGKRFNPYHLPAGTGGGEFTSAGGGGGGGGGKSGGHAKAPAAGTGHGHGHTAAAAVHKHRLLQRAAADRQRAHQLEQQLKVLEQQLHAHQKSVAAAKKTKATVAKAKAKIVHHHPGHTHHHTKKIASLKQRISSLRSEISSLLAQADHLTAQAKAL